MKVYYFCKENGVTALVGRETFLNITKKANILKALPGCHPFHMGGPTNHEMVKEGLRHMSYKPIFTFTNTEHMEHPPWFTGDYGMFEALRTFLEERGDVVSASSFYVPFSKKPEEHYLVEQEMLKDITYVTSEEQFRDAFGITTTELKTWAASRPILTA